MDLKIGKINFHLILALIVTVQGLQFFVWKPPIPLYSFLLTTEYLYADHA